MDIENYYIHTAKPEKADGETDERFNKRYDEWMARDRETANLGEVIVGKNRHGTVGNITLFWNAEYMRFSDYANPNRLPEQRG